jgi:hypothetical protein
MTFEHISLLPPSTKMSHLGADHDKDVCDRCSPQADLLPLLFTMLSRNEGIPMLVWERAMMVWRNAFQRRYPVFWRTIQRIDRFKITALLLLVDPPFSFRTSPTRVTLGVNCRTDRESWIRRMGYLLDGFRSAFPRYQLREFACGLTSAY